MYENNHHYSAYTISSPYKYYAQNKLQKMWEDIMASNDENIIIVSHGDLLSVFNAMFLGLSIESINEYEIFGLAGGVSYMFENDEGKRFIKRISDMSYIS